MRLREIIYYYMSTCNGEAIQKCHTAVSVVLGRETPFFAQSAKKNHRAIYLKNCEMYVATCYRSGHLFFSLGAYAATRNTYRWGSVKATVDESD